MTGTLTRPKETAPFQIARMAETILVPPGGGVTPDNPDGRATLAFQQIADWVVPTWPGGKHPQQFHLDFSVGDIAAAEPQVLALGARPHEHQPSENGGFRVYLDPAGQDLNRGEFYDGATPRHQFALTSSLDLPGGFEFDAQYRRVGALRRLPEIVSGEGRPGYDELDVRLAWRASPQWRVSVIGRSLLHDEHVEFGTPESRGPVRRAVYAKIDWDF